MQALRIPPPATEERLPRFDTPNILWFFGAIATASMSIALCATIGSSDRGVWIMLLALLFMAVYSALAVVLRTARWWVPGGLFATIVVAMVPAAMVGFEHLIGTLPREVNYDPFREFSGSIFTLGLVTIAVGLLVYSLVRFDFTLAVVAAAVLVTVQFFLPAVDDHPSSDDYAASLIVTGAMLVLIGLLLDSRAKRRDAFWWHVFGLGGVAAGLVYFTGSRNDAGGWAAMLVTGALVLLLAGPLRRATWAAYGVAGGYGPLVHYVAEGGGRWRIPLLLLFVSLAVVAFGLVVHRFGDAWGARLRARYRF